MKNIGLLFLFLLLAQFSFGQKGLSGLWEGTITKGGIYSEKGTKFELYLEVKGKVITGRSYVYLENGEVIEMDVEGKMYSDRSIYLKETGFISDKHSDLIPPFNRKYQFIYNRSIWDSTLEGYWQEMIPESFYEGRRRGRIILRKAAGSKA